MAGMSGRRNGTGGRGATDPSGTLRPVGRAEAPGSGGVGDPTLVPQAVAAAVGVREEPGRPLLATLTDALRPKLLLVVLDNCEHLLEACARLADALLRACPHVRVLATSREALGLAGETIWRVPSLPVPGDAAGQPARIAAGVSRNAAVRLFTDRAAAVRPGFAITDHNAPEVAALCVRLDGRQARPWPNAPKRTY
jgi:predicted ATPase